MRVYKFCKGKEFVAKNITFLFILLFAVIFQIYNLTLIYNITFSLSSVFILIIYKTWGVKRAIVTSITAYVIGAFVDFKNIYEVFSILEVIFIYGLNKKFKNLNIIYADMIFWVILGLPTKLFVYKFVVSNMQFKFLFFNSFKDCINGIINCVIADVITTYTPLRKLNSSYEGLIIRFKDLIFHVLIAAIAVPLIFNVLEAGLGDYEQRNEEIRHEAEIITESLSQEIDSWEEDEKLKLLIKGKVEQGYIKNKISEVDKNGLIVVILTNVYNEIIYTNDEKIEMIESITWKDITENDMAFNMEFYEGSDFYAVRSYLLDNRINVYIKIPAIIYQEQYYEENMDLIKAILIFSLVIILGIMLINKLIFKSIEAIAKLTSTAFENIHDLNKISWPQSPFIEINSLIDNFKIMLFKLEEKFDESTNLNKRLEAQKRQLIDSKKRLHKQAYYDNLTGLPNRLSLNEQLRGLSILSNNIEKVAIIFFDINRFKEINDTLGHDVGDELLKLVAKRLQSLITERILIYRIGGDEFVVIARVKGNDDILKIGAHLVDLLKDRFYIRGKELDVSISLGASVYPDDDSEIDAIIKYADIAMYKSKQGGRCELIIFNNKIKSEFMTKYIIEKEIIYGLENEEFTMMYQPKIRTYDNKVLSFEALIRWNNRELGQVSPEEFIPIAEETELILSIDQWVINSVCKELYNLNRKGYRDIQISVNISAKHFAHGDIVLDINNALNMYKVNPKQLKIEITEGVMISNIDAVLKIIKQLNEIGVQISIDDFGTGFSSFSQLINLPIDEIKIDKGFIEGILTNNKKALVVSLIVDLAHRLDLNIVAEGVESLEEDDFLRGIGCDELQGYLFSEPLSVTGIYKYLEEIRANMGGEHEEIFI